MPTLPSVETPAGPVRYAQAGRGPDLVLLHGAMTSVEDMVLGPFEALSARFRVTAFDRPGHGATPRGRLEGAPARQAARVLAAMDALGLGRSIVVGQSFGAALALDMALNAPDRVQGVLAISPIVFPEIRVEHLLYGVRAIPGLGDLIAFGPGRVLDAALLPILWEAIFAPQPMPAHFRRLYPFALASGPGQMLALGEEAVLAVPDLAASAARYGRLQAPITILAGTADWLAPPWTHAAVLAAAAPRARLRLLDGLGHMLHHFAIGEVVEAAEGLLSEGAVPAAA